MSKLYDLIIVGAGTAGCVLAERLTTSGKIRTLLIEAGGPPKNPFVSIPAGMPKLFKSEVDWAFESEPQTSAGGRRIFIPRGKMLGGSSNMNAQMHQWCHPVDFDSWAEAGAQGWSWADVRPVFQAQEHWLGNDGDMGRGRRGSMFVSLNKNARPLSHDFVEAARQAGFGRMPGYNGHSYQGAWIAELAHKDGKRFSAYNAFLVPAMQRTNLDVVTDAHVTKIVIEKGRARGVTISKAGTEDTFMAKGVVLCAGAFASPQLLMLSGIGPATELEKFAIPVYVNRPAVGDNLQDHPVSGFVFNTNSKDTFKAAESPLNLLRYLLFKKGMLASGGVEGFAFTQIQPGPVSAPDLEIMFLPFEHRIDFLDPPQVHAFSLAAAVVAPRSRGRLTLKSADPLIPLAIDFGLLSDPEGIDASILLKGLRLCRKIANTAPLSAYNVKELRPGLAAQSDQDILLYVHNDIQTVYHPTSTCRMGSDENAVVDSKLGVRGVENLWVADASVMPSVPRGHPNAVVAMIAQRASQWIEQTMLS